MLAGHIAITEKLKLELGNSVSASHDKQEPDLRQRQLLPLVDSLLTNKRLLAQLSGDPLLCLY